MSRVADFDRSTEGMKALSRRVSHICDNFFDIAVIENDSQISELYKLYDMVLTQRATLSAMLCSAEILGTHGSAFVDRQPDGLISRRETRTLTKGAVSYMENVSAMPMPELWFETLLAKKKQETQNEAK